MDKTYQIAEIFDYYFSDGYRLHNSDLLRVYEKLYNRSSQFTAEDLCNAIIDDFFENNSSLDKSKLDEYVTYSSIYAVACDLAGKLTYGSEYSGGRGGCMFWKMDNNNKMTIVSLRDVVNRMKNG